MEINISDVILEVSFTISCSPSVSRGNARKESALFTSYYLPSTGQQRMVRNRKGRQGLFAICHCDMCLHHPIRIGINCNIILLSFCVKYVRKRCNIDNMNLEISPFFDFCVLNRKGNRLCLSSISIIP